MLFNKSNQGAQELQDRTGSYYANNDFSRIETDVLLAEKDIIKIVGGGVYARALNHYNSSNYQSESTDHVINNKLVQMLQMPIAYLATYNYYQSNLVSHQDTGRKVSIDNQNEKMAWEWMLDRDDRAHLLKVNKTVDLLISWLEENNITEWKNSDNRKLTRELFVNSEKVFQESYPIDESPRFFYTVLAWNNEVQTKTIKKALGALYAPLLAFWQSSLVSGSGTPPDNADELQELLEMVQKTIPLFVMSKAVKRLSLQVLPDSVVQQFKSDRGARAASTPALTEVIEWHHSSLLRDAYLALDDIKLFLQRMDPESGRFQLIPENKPSRKFART
ncbi:DUF6712 family protein [Mongoliitalea lutea]|uniref:Uncharacterized protein n=1 Tax=Mongoliitalea lutea TaxID=849756 RepID=A0A8J3D016_9BACT|nr:DUF6712 family protein [Mongoliitalea lutea]GHB44404.1 hypothetical protein GCM10008106_26840 [Mongoliitalea lutea]